MRITTILTDGGLKPERNVEETRRIDASQKSSSGKSLGPHSPIPVG
jgi:hypothetical protein